MQPSLVFSLLPPMYLIRPVQHLLKPVNAFNRLDFPDPEGPIMADNCPFLNRPSIFLKIFFRSPPHFFFFFLQLLLQTRRGQTSFVFLSSDKSIYRFLSRPFFKRNILRERASESKRDRSRVRLDRPVSDSSDLLIFRIIIVEYARETGEHHSILRIFLFFDRDSSKIFPRSSFFAISS